MGEECSPLFRHADDIIEELNGIAPLVTEVGAKATESSAPLLAELTEVQRRIWDFLADQPRHIDDMARKLQLPIAELSGNLMMLEMKKIVRRLPGNQYERRQ